ncbi:MAG: RNP-1 like RNA-binding protein, partial [Candidatus Magnetoglobus multicellularis str. Araruama]
MKTIYVGNIPFSSTKQDIEELFEKHGEVHSVKFINDRISGKFRGFGFVEMDDDAADKAIESLDGYELDGRNLKINEAKGRKPPRQDHRGGGGGGGY